MKYFLHTINTHNIQSSISHPFYIFFRHDFRGNNLAVVFFIENIVHFIPARDFDLSLSYSCCSDVALRIEFHDFMAPISSSSWSYPKRGGLDAFFTAASASNFSFSNFRFSSMTMRFNATLDGKTLVYCLTKMRFFSESGVNISTNA